jgi:hypothetical protein
VVNTNRGILDRLMLLLGQQDTLQRELPVGPMPGNVAQAAFYEWAKGQRNAEALGEPRQ